MPYINNGTILDFFEKKLIELRPMTAGELNYCITRICINFRNIHGLKYKTLNDIIGALECAKQEFYRRIVSPYEDEKIKENGDVF